MKIYTGSGDRGKTSLLSGERLGKSDLRVEAYGDVDELNSFLAGLVAALPPTEGGLAEEIKQIQSVLLHIGARLAVTPGSPVSAELEEITEEHSKELERAIDRIDESLPPLKDFLLPGGHISAAWAHLARTVCRRAERHVVRLSTSQTGIGDGEQLRNVIVYLNRLSDYLFVVARLCNKIHGLPDTVWKK
ncbi:MAG: cob(I)yrinic acid a,c-diamide adenosyltransferase [Deltaproteobacteria bacterium]|jgi:cob(I)alamin adenosyltransferase